MAIVQKSVSSYPTAYTTSGSINGTRYKNAIGKGADTSAVSGNDYASGNSSSKAYIYYSFEFEGIPEDATIDSVSCKVKGHLENSSRSTANLQLYAGSTAKGSASKFTSTSAQTVTLTTGTWTRSDTLDSVRFDDVSYDESTQIIEMKAIASKNFARYYVVTSIYPNIQVGTLVYTFSYNEIPTPDYRNGTYKLVATTDKFIPSYSWVSTSSDEDIMSRLESIEARLTALEG